MAKTKRELLKSAPWRDAPEDGDNKFQDARLKMSSEPGTMPTMHVPGKKVYNSETDGVGEDSLSEIDPELRYSFQRNFQFLQHVFSVDTVVKPLPPSVAYNISRNLTFFTRIFTQFFDPDGIADAQKSLGLGQEERVRKVRLNSDNIDVFDERFIRPWFGRISSIKVAKAYRHNFYHMSFRISSIYFVSPLPTQLSWFCGDQISDVGSNANSIF